MRTDKFSLGFLKIPITNFSVVLRMVSFLTSYGRDMPYLIRTTHPRDVKFMESVKKLRKEES